MNAAAEEIRQALHATLGPCIECGGDADDEVSEGPICNVCWEEMQAAEREAEWEYDPPFDTVEEMRGER